MSAFAWAQGRRHPVKAQVVGEYLEEMEKRDGSVSARQVLREAKPEGAVLHPCFTWDDKKAADRWRLKESRDLIGDLRVIKATPKTYQENDGPKEVKIKAFIRVTEGNDAARYGGTWEAMAREDARKIIINNAKKEMECFVARYRELLDIAQLVDEVMQEESIKERNQKEEKIKQKRRDRRAY